MVYNHTIVATEISIWQSMDVIGLVLFSITAYHNYSSHINAFVHECVGDLS